VRPWCPTSSFWILRRHSSSFKLAHFNDVKCISHLGRVGHGRGNDTAAGAREVEGRPSNAATPLLASSLRPGGGGGATSTRHDVEELTGAHVDRQRREDQAPVGAVVHEEHLVESQRLDVFAALRVVNQNFALAQESVVRGVPRRSPVPRRSLGRCDRICRSTR
jgi:hypothetical protein